MPSGAPDDFLDGLDSRYRAIWTGHSADAGYTRRNVARGRDEVYLADGGVRTGALDSLDQRSWTVRLRVARDF